MFWKLSILIAATAVIAWAEPKQVQLAGPALAKKLIDRERSRNNPKPTPAKPRPSAALFTGQQLEGEFLGFDGVTLRLLRNFTSAWRQWGFCD